MTRVKWIVSVFPLCALMACATAAPPKELLDARTAYAQAEQGPAARLVPADLHVARESLDAAEHVYHKDPGSQDATDSAYIALRKIERAELLGTAAAAMSDKQRADRDVTKTQAQLLEERDAQLKNTQGELAQQKAETAQERDARVAAEAKAKDAMDALAKSLAVKSDDRGTVITLSGGVLFVTNQATILPGATAQLDHVAEALKSQAEHHFTVEGHTDNQGTDTVNDSLSARRANAVREYLIVHGVSADAITATGYGSHRPVGDNKTTEGRAMNRRVEIVVDKAGPQVGQAATP